MRIADCGMNVNGGNIVRKKIDIKDKTLHLQFVYLTEEEYTALCEKFGADATAAWIEELNDGIGQHGYKYESHYYTILNWARKRLAAASPSPTSPTRGEATASAAERAAVLVLDTIQDRTKDYLPDFDAKTRAAIVAVMQARGYGWRFLRMRVQEDRNELDAIKAEIIRAYVQRGADAP